MENLQRKDYLGKIVDETSQLPLACQEYILAVARGMAFTREVLKKSGHPDFK